MSWIDINAFMERFHALERELNLFESAVDGELWWDSVRFDVCYYLYDCLTGLAYSSAHHPVPRRRLLGIGRRWLMRQKLLAGARRRQHEVLALRVPRNVIAGQARDVVLDPVLDALRRPLSVIDTVPRRYHLPDSGSARRGGTVPPTLSNLITVLLEHFGIGHDRAPVLDALVRRGRADYAAQINGYRRVFEAARPKAVIMVQNGIEKALFHVARERKVPTVELQHGLIGYGHPAYSYSREIDYQRQTGMPDLFLTFSAFWQQSGYYPAHRQDVIGTDHFAAGFAAPGSPLGIVMIISANIYHRELLELTRDIAALLPDRRLVYKLHPNQAADAPAIRDALTDRPNVVVGDALAPASQLMEDVSHIVAVQSTVVYEALQHGRRVCIVPRHDYQIHADIFSLPTVSIADTAEEIGAALSMPRQGEPGPVFFEPFSPQRVREFLLPLFERPA